MDNASCKTAATALVTKEISPNQKFVPVLSMIATRKVMVKTTISIYVLEVNSRTRRIMVAATSRIPFMSCCNAALSSLSTVV